MMTSITKTPQPMTALYGLKFEAAQGAIKVTDPCIHVRHGWFHLHFGRSEKFGEFLLVVTMSDSFLLSTQQQSAGPVRKRRKPGDWVYSINKLPDDFLRGSTGCTFLSCGDCSIAYGRDHARRDFLSVQMSARQLQLLFRDPNFRPPRAWNPQPATVISDTAVLDPMVMAESIGDAELDALLDALG